MCLIACLRFPLDRHSTVNVCFWSSTIMLHSVFPCKLIPFYHHLRVVRAVTQGDDIGNKVLPHHIIIIINFFYIAECYKVLSSK